MGPPTHLLSRGCPLERCGEVIEDTTNRMDQYGPRSYWVPFGAVFVMPFPTTSRCAGHPAKSGAVTGSEALHGWGSCSSTTRR